MNTKGGNRVKRNTRGGDRVKWDRDKMIIREAGNRVIWNTKGIGLK